MAQSESCSSQPAQSLPSLPSINQALARSNAKQRLVWALENLPGQHAVVSNFGVHAAAFLHLVSCVDPQIPVILVDTGYLLPQTAGFAEQLRDLLQLNLIVRPTATSSHCRDVKFGRLWAHGLTGMKSTHDRECADPLNSVMDELAVTCWFDGTRTGEAGQVHNEPAARLVGKRVQIQPIVDWSCRDVHRYMRRHRLPYHPFWAQGYCRSDNESLSKGPHLPRHACPENVTTETV